MQPVNHATSWICHHQPQKYTYNKIFKKISNISRNKNIKKYEKKTPHTKELINADKKVENPTERYVQNDKKYTQNNKITNIHRNSIEKLQIPSNKYQQNVANRRDATAKNNVEKTKYNLTHRPTHYKTISDIKKTKEERDFKRKYYVLNKRKDKCDDVVWKRRFHSKWRINSAIFVALTVLSLTSRCGSVEVMSSSVLASLLGYPSTCSISGDLRPCTLTLTCWLRGGSSLPGCGGWLFSCCHQQDTYESFDNSIVTSDWRYKSPPKLRQVPQRSVVPTNVFRRRVDDDTSQMECGLPSTRILQKRIIGGREARFAEFPWQAHVRISEFQCGGVLVSRRYVATAAHCVSRARIRDIAVWLGALDTSAPPGDRSARKLGVIQKILHPLFQFRMTQPDRYDIALLKLSRPITFMSHILPICLPDYDMELRGRSGVIAGWGKTDASNGHTGTNMLRSATVPILSREQCITWHQSKQISVEIHSEMICAGHSDGHQDACLGDSGGPLIVLDNGRYYLVGITSAGFGCGVDHQPGIYHNVRLTVNWIRHVISPSVHYNEI